MRRLAWRLRRWLIQDAPQQISPFDIGDYIYHESPESLDSMYAAMMHNRDNGHHILARDQFSTIIFAIIQRRRQLERKEQLLAKEEPLNHECKQLPFRSITV